MNFALEILCQPCSSHIDQEREREVSQDFICCQTSSCPQRHHIFLIKRRGHLFKNWPRTPGIYSNLAFIRGPVFSRENTVSLCNNFGSYDLFVLIFLIYFGTQRFC